MPPQTEPIPRPTTRGEDAVAWLEAHGIVARKPPIRSSDFEMAISDPFRYYLTRRLGLAPALRVSDALSQGSWFHHLFFLWTEPQAELEAHMTHLRDARRAELQEVCGQVGVTPEATQKLIDREERNAEMATAWFEALMTVKLPNRNGNLKQWMNQPHFRDLGGELKIRVKLPEAPRVWSVCVLDRLLYHREQNTLWILDPKTCSEPTTVRIASCPLEFQTQLYLRIVQHTLQTGQLVEHFDLPTDVRLGGFIHIPVQKPPLVFGTKDRDCELVPHVLKSGPRKGETEIRRVYQGEPQYSNYLKRCLDWYHARGEYEALAPERAENPVVNFSVINARILDDPDWVEEFEMRLRYLAEIATLPAKPHNFVRSARSINRHGRLDDFAPFYLTDVGSWPALIQEQRLIQTWRDMDFVETEDDRDLIEVTTLEH